MSVIFRSWLRSLSTRPEQFLRIAPYLYRGAMRDAGTMVLAGAGEGFIRYRIEETPDSLRGSIAWHRWMQGMGCGLLDLAQTTGEVHVAPSLRDTHSVDVLYLWEG